MKQELVAFLGLLQAALWPAFLVWLILRYAGTVGPQLTEVLQSLLPRVREASVTGLKFDPVANDASRQEYLPEPNQLRDFRGESRTAAMSEVEKSIHSSLTAMVNDGKISSEERLDYIIKQLAVTRLIAHFDHTYWLIFGSQIRGLQFLKERGSATTQEAKEFFEQYKNSDPDFYKEYTVESWLDFLKNQMLIQINEDKITLTHIGDDFLQFIYSRCLRTDKRG